MARDDFPRPVIDLLQRRVAGRCSNPACRRQTLGPGADVPVVVNVGVAAHIHAAASGGPRYLAQMTREERRGFGNALWLCANCASLIDRDTARYPAELLREWKQLAEDQARREQGQRLPEVTDAIEQLTMAFTGAASKFIPPAIGNVHSAAAATLAKLDPRFLVETEFKAGTTRFKILAKELVAFSVHVGEDSASAWAQGMSQVFEKGRPASLPMKGVTFVGSRLLEAMQDLAQEGSLKVTPIGKSGALKVFLPDEDGNSVIEDLRGTLTAGRNALHFEGTGFGGVVAVEMDLDRTKEGVARGSLSLILEFRRWQGIDVRQTPYLEKVYRLLRCLVHDPEKLLVHLEVEGEHVLTGRNVAMGDSQQFAYLLNFVAYVRRARTVATAMASAIPIEVEAEFSEAEHTAVADAADTFDGKKTYDRTCFTETPSFTLVGTDGGAEIRALTERGEFQPLQMRFPAREIVIFGRAVTLPPLELNLNCVRLHIKSSQAIDAGMEFGIQTSLGPEFLCEYRFLQVEDGSASATEFTPHAVSKLLRYP